MMFLANKCNKPLLLPVVCFKHDARPNCAGNPAYCASIDANASARARDSCRVVQRPPREPVRQYGYRYLCWQSAAAPGQTAARPRSEEHTSELQSLMRISYAVFCLTKKNKNQQNTTTNSNKHIQHIITQNH